ncbi:hypothetical protein ACVR1G_00310 [Streptococcus dentasini]
MISIEKLENTVKSLNMTVLILECLHILGGVLSVVGYYINMANLKNGVYEKQGFTSEQIETIRQATTPWMLVSGIIFFVIGIAILVLAIRNHKAIKAQEYVSYLPYYLGFGLLVLYLVNFAISGFKIWGLIFPIIYAALYIATYLQARKLNANG